MKKIKEIAEQLIRVKKLTQELSDVKKWDNTYIFHQIQRRKAGYTFTIEDHIRAMVYSMLSSSIPWQNFENMIDVETGRIMDVDEVFFQYDINRITDETVDYFYSELKNIEKPKRITGYATRKQVEALIKTNIPLLQSFEAEGGIDYYYNKHIDIHDLDGDIDYKRLIIKLSIPGSETKMVQLGVALTSEYLRNVGYDLPKPDRHICRILGKNHLGCSDKEVADPYEAIDIVKEIAKETGLWVSETDYYLWSYCANGYLEICAKRNPKCDSCCFYDICNYSFK